MDDISVNVLTQGISRSLVHLFIIRLDKLVALSHIERYLVECRELAWFPEALRAECALMNDSKELKVETWLER